MRILFIIYSIIPWVLPVSHQFEAILILGIIISVPSTVLNVSFSQFFMESVPSEWRGTVLGVRSAIGSVVSFIVTLSCGQLLTRVQFPFNYQIVFFIGFVGGITTIYQLTHIHTVNLQSEVANPILKTSDYHRPEASLSGRSFLPKINKDALSYLRVISFLFIYTLIANMVAPLIPNLLVHQLKLSDEWISIGTASNTIIIFIISLFIIKIAQIIGNRKGNTLGIVALSLQTLILSLARNSTHYLISALAGGVATGMLNTAQTNYLYDHVPPSDQSVWFSLNVWLGNIAIFAGALLGPMIASHLGTMAALILFGCLEFGIGISMLFWS